jgi:hypothetical protein
MREEKCALNRTFIHQHQKIGEFKDIMHMTTPGTRQQREM